MSELTLDEAIKHCNEVAEQNEFETRIYDELNRPGDEEYRNNHCQCVADHRQLAEWLTELKQWKENPFDVIDDYCSKIDDCVECDFIDCCPNRACKEQK